jgi:hypothetical protein
MYDLFNRANRRDLRATPPSGTSRRISAQGAARSEKLRRHAEGRLARDNGSAGDDLMLRQWYAAEVAPRLGAVARTETARAIGVSPARLISHGTVPHPRHSEVLAQLGGLRCRSQ